MCDTTHVHVPYYCVCVVGTAVVVRSWKQTCERRYDAFICVTQLMHTYDTTARVQYCGGSEKKERVIYEEGKSHICDMTHSYV